MADIFVAQQWGARGYERTVVVKTLRSDFQDDGELVDLLMHEARIASCLEHENICELYEVGIEGTTHYLAMEFVFGRDLGQIHDRCAEFGVTVPPEHATTIISDVLDALHHAHREACFEGRPLRAIHRDICPRNIVVGFDGSAKLLDFGLARATAQISRTRAGVLKGKCAYMSPEQVTLQKLDERADLFGAGILLWEMLTGQRLFHRASDYETVRAVEACRVPFPRSVRGDLPFRPAWVAYRALRKSRRWRYRTARRMHAALVGRRVQERADARDALAGWLAALFARELMERDASLRRARGDPSRHRQIQDAGFEMLDEITDPNLRLSELASVTGASPTRAIEIRRKRIRGRWRWCIAMPLLVSAGLAGGIFLGSLGPGLGSDHGTITVVSNTSEVRVMVGDTDVGWAPVADVAVLPGLHQVRGLHGERGETVEVMVEAGEKKVVELTFGATP